MLLPKMAEDAWFLSEEEEETMRPKKARDIDIRGSDRFEKQWIKIALLDPFVWLLGVAFFTSSVTINGFGVFLPTIIQGMGYVLITYSTKSRLLTHFRYASLKVNYMMIPVYILGAICLVIQVSSAVSSSSWAAVCLS